MIRLATVFSGIGAVEHALKRMGIDYKIVFACDNGDLDILSKKIDVNLDSIGSEIIFLERAIKNSQNNLENNDIYFTQLRNMYRKLKKEYESLLPEVNSVPDGSENIRKVLDGILEQKDLKKVRRKEYTEFRNQLGKGSKPQNRLRELQIILEISNDLKKDNRNALKVEQESYSSSDRINWVPVAAEVRRLYSFLEKHKGKKLIRWVQDLSQRTSQLHEKLGSLEIQQQLDCLEDNWTEKKKIVDNLYKGMEKRNKVRQSYLANYDVDEKDFHWDAVFLDGRQYKNKVDLLVGGSPCQSFSLVGKQRGLEDTRGTLFYEFARLIREISPKIFIYENVKAVLSNDNGRTWEKMKEVFTELGYTWYAKVLNSRDYGIPQNRERLFVVGFREDVAPKEGFEFPEPVPLETKMKDFLLDNAPGGYFLPKKGVEFVTREKNINKRYTQIDGDIQLCQKKNQQFNWHGDFVFQSEEEAEENNIEDLEKYFLSEKVKRYVLSEGTKNFYSRPETDLDVARPLLTTMHKMHRAGVDNYVTTQGRLRKLTPRECLRLMGFSDDFRIVVSDTSMYQQAGNSIVVDVLIAILKQIDIENYGNKYDNSGKKI